VDLDQDYLNIQGNFTAANTSFGIDHVPFDDTTAQNGYHKDIHFNPVSTTVTNAPNNYVTADQYPQGVPVTVAGIGQLFSSSVTDGSSTDTGLYWLTGNGLKVAMTRNFAPTHTASGVTFLPGGLILQWGTALTSSLNNPYTLTWPSAFPNAFFSATLSLTEAAGRTRGFVQFTAAPTTTGALVALRDSDGSLSAGRFYYLAIGY
jgi:hypothetical protein